MNTLTRRDITGNSTRAKIFGFALCALLFALSVSAEAQQSKSVPRIGYLSRDIHPADSRAPAPRNLEAFRQGLRELGYVEGKTIIIEYRFADGRVERLAALAEELIGIKAEIIVEDGDISRLYQRPINPTDCPDGVYEFFLTDDVLMLCSEY